MHGLKSIKTADRNEMYTFRVAKQPSPRKHRKKSDYSIAQFEMYIVRSVARFVSKQSPNIISKQFALASKMFDLFFAPLLTADNSNNPNHNRYQCEQAR